VRRTSPSHDTATKRTDRVVAAEVTLRAWPSTLGLRRPSPPCTSCSPHQPRERRAPHALDRLLGRPRAAVAVVAVGEPGEARNTGPRDRPAGGSESQNIHIAEVHDGTRAAAVAVGSRRPATLVGVRRRSSRRGVAAAGGRRGVGSLCPTLPGLGGAQNGVWLELRAAVVCRASSVGVATSDDGGTDPSLSSAELFAAHHAKIRGQILSMMRDRDEADDLAQEVFLQAHRRPASLRDPTLSSHGCTGSRPMSAMTGFVSGGVNRRRRTSIRSSPRTPTTPVSATPSARSSTSGASGSPASKTSNTSTSTAPPAATPELVQTYFQRAYDLGRSFDRLQPVTRSQPPAA
jgi:hypothetical protein